MTSFIRREDIRSWGGTLLCPHMVAMPTWSDQLPRLVKECVASNAKLLPVGLRRSYGDSCLNPDDHIIDMSALDRFIQFDPVARRVRAQAGTSLSEILRVLVHQGFFLPVTPGTQFVTLGGAVANDVHGKNHHLNGTIGRWVRKLGLIRSDGNDIELTSDDETGLFSATIGGLGLTGVIRWVELEVIPIESALIDCENIPFENVDEFFEIAAQSEENFTYTVSWIDCLSNGSSLGRGIFTRGNHASTGSRLLDGGNTKFDMPMNLPGFAMNRFSIKAFNALYFWNGKRKEGQSRASLYPFFYPLDAIGNWNRMYGSKGMYQYQSAVPPHSQLDATKEMLKAISTSGQGSFLAVLKTFGKISSPGMLSFPMEGTTLALDFPNRGPSTLNLMEKLDAIVLEAGGRLYPAKDGRMPAKMFQSGYSNWQNFAKHVDPAFSSHFWQRVSQ